ncbi:MAG: redoxin domain-containing protein [Armatimonadetes bacterium]|nr:redoxin domain-containing protein [Armatimonadota bacterium]
MAIANYGGQSQQRWGDSTATTGETFRDFLITDLKGVPQQTMIARKKGMVLVAFFTTTDDASKQLLPLLQSLSDAYKEAGKLTVLAVSETDDDDAVAAFAKANALTFPVVIDRERYHAQTYGFTVYPTLILLTGAGIVAHKAKGAKAISDLQAVSDKIGTFAGAETLAKLDGAAFTPAVMPPPADPAATLPKP